MSFAARILQRFRTTSVKPARNVQRQRASRRSTLESLESRETMTATPSGFYSYDGTGNNLQNTNWGSVGVDLLRTVPSQYSNGFSTPAGANRPSARVISNTVSAQSTDIPSERYLSAMVYVWGQFIDHDLDLTTSGTTSFNIAVPKGDPQFDPRGTGTQVIPLNRSNVNPLTGTNVKNVLQQVNTITAFLDGSMIYGSDAAQAASLRTMSGGRLKTSDGAMLPVDSRGQFIAGDIRVNENLQLSSMQTLFMREHNRVAGQMAARNPSWNDERLYQEARKYVIAELQVITYNEYLPILLGPNAIAPYQGYKPNTNPGISTEFSTAAFRFGHSMLGEDVKFLANDATEIRPAVALKDAFFRPDILRQTGIDPVLKYVASDPAQEPDIRVVDGLRNFLFGQPGQGGLDLVSLNIQRGRDHGLPDYNTVRGYYNLPRVTSFAQITSNPTLQRQLQQLYGNVNNIDLWVGGLAENDQPGSSLGPTFTRIMADQFQRLRNGDRLWYQNTMSGAQLAEVQRTTLGDVIKRNTGITNLQPEVFFFRTGITGKVFVDPTNGRSPVAVDNQPGIGGRTIQLLDSKGTVVMSTQTDRFGRYYFDRIDTGTYTVREVLPADARSTTGTFFTVKITRGGLVANRNFGETRLPSKPVKPGLIGATVPSSLELEAIFASLGQDIENPTKKKK